MYLFTLIIVCLCFHEPSLTPPFFFWRACIKPGKLAIVYLCVRGIDFSLLHFKTVLYFFVFHFISSPFISFFLPYACLSLFGYYFKFTFSNL
jgi:hypothetical protein